MRHRTCIEVREVERVQRIVDTYVAYLNRVLYPFFRFEIHHFTFMPVRYPFQLFFVYVCHATINTAMNKYKRNQYVKQNFYHFFYYSFHGSGSLCFKKSSIVCVGILPVGIPIVLPGKERPTYYLVHSIRSIHNVSFRLSSSRT